jgi:hypothetical protein
MPVQAKSANYILHEIGVNDGSLQVAEKGQEVLNWNRSLLEILWRARPVQQYGQMASVTQFCFQLIRSIVDELVADHIPYVIGIEQNYRSGTIIGQTWWISINNYQISGRRQPYRELAAAPCSAFQGHFSPVCPGDFSDDAES